MAKEKKQKQESKDYELVRVLGKDIIGSKSVHSGLTNVKGISWTMSNVICKSLKLDKKTKIGDLTEDQIKSIENFIRESNFPHFLKNRQKDFDKGEDFHLYGSDLSLTTEFDVKRLKKIKSYKGIRHTAKLPVRGQRTKSNFRPNRSKSTGIRKKQKAD